MSDYQKVYEICIKTMAPVHIGSGEKITKKEYIFEGFKHKAIIPDLSKMYAGLTKMGKSREFERYMLDNGGDLRAWLKANNVERDKYMEWAKYSVSTADAVFEEKSKKEICTFVKDAYGNPYIPGSSLKGAIRTALIAKDIMDNKEKYNKLRNEIKNAKPDNRKRYLSYENKNISVDALHTIKRDFDKYKQSDMTNDCMSGIIISDSNSVSCDDLVLCQKIDVNTAGKEKPINILRECIRPGVAFKFKLCIDTTKCSYIGKDIYDAICDYFMNYYKCFIKKYPLIMPKHFKNAIYIGGGTGFANKTLMYSMFEEKEAVVEISKVFKNTLPYKIEQEHKHYLDVKKGVSPHVIKATRYQEQLYEMGMCSFIIKEISDKQESV